MRVEGCAGRAVPGKEGERARVSGRARGVEPVLTPQALQAHAGLRALAHVARVRGVRGRAGRCGGGVSVVGCVRG